MLDARTGDWDGALLEQAGIDTRVLPAVVEPGGRAGTLLPELARPPRRWPATSRSSGPPATTRPRPWPPCRAKGTSPTSRAARGRWPGVEHDEPVLDRRAMEAGFTNELGVGGRVRFQRNLTGLWLLEEALRQWRALGDR